VAVISRSRPPLEKLKKTLRIQTWTRKDVQTPSERYESGGALFVAPSFTGRWRNSHLSYIIKVALGNPEGKPVGGGARFTRGAKKKNTKIVTAQRLEGALAIQSGEVGKNKGEEQLSGVVISKLGAATHGRGGKSRLKREGRRFKKNLKEKWGRGWCDEGLAALPSEG